MKVEHESDPLPGAGGSPTGEEPAANQVPAGQERLATESERDEVNGLLGTGVPSDSLEA